MTDGGYGLEEIRRMHGYDRITRTSLMHHLGEEGERIEAEAQAELDAILSDNPPPRVPRKKRSAP